MKTQQRARLRLWVQRLAESLAAALLAAAIGWLLCGILSDLRWLPGSVDPIAATVLVGSVSGVFWLLAAPPWAPLASRVDWRIDPDAAWRTALALPGGGDRQRIEAALRGRRLRFIGSERLRPLVIGALLVGLWSLWAHPGNGNAPPAPIDQNAAGATSPASPVAVTHSSPSGSERSPQSEQPEVGGGLDNGRASLLSPNLSWTAGRDFGQFDAAVRRYRALRAQRIDQAD